LVLGTFSELRSSCFSLFAAIESGGRCLRRELLEGAAEGRPRALQAEDHAFLGLTVQRGWARLILERFHDLGDPTAATREPDSASHELRTSLFPDT
jgi:hypothetical protein